MPVLSLKRSNSEREEDDRAKAMNKNIQQMLKEEHKKSQFNRKVLLLGCGEAGKSTFIKQVRIPSSNAIDAIELSDFI